MKSYNEMAKNALRRIDEENKALAKRKKILKRTLIPTFSLCLAAVIGISVMGGFGIKVAPETEIEESLEYQYEGAIDTSNKDTTGKLTANDGEVAVGGSARPNNSNGSPAVQSSAPQDSGETTDDPCILVVDITYNGKTYIQAENIDASQYKAEMLLGDAKDFSAYCRVKNINGKVYTVIDSSDFLLMELDDGQRVLLTLVK